MLQDEGLKSLREQGEYARDIGYRLVEWWEKRREWSQRTFGDSTSRGPVGPLLHLAKEVDECLSETNRANRLVEYADLLHLVFDAADRDGWDLEAVLAACEEKLKINMARKWPTPTAGMPVEHERK